MFGNNNPESLGFAKLHGFELPFWEENETERVNIDNPLETWWGEDGKITNDVEEPHIE